MAKRRRRRTSVRGRSVSSLRRQQGELAPRQCILIVCEGEKTEPNYFWALRREWKLTPVEVSVVPGSECGSAPISVVDHAIRVRNQRKRDAQNGSTSQLEFDEVWCVFDQECSPSHSSFHRAVQKARDNGLELAVSTPAFEYWYLLHFAKTDQPFGSAHEVIEALKRHIPHYEKGWDGVHELLSRTKVAIKRARQLWSQRADKEEEYPNPSTLVFALVEKLQAMCSPRA